jgi:amino acid adenylation domain-containing protein
MTHIRITNSQAMADHADPRFREEIAIIGMAGRFPGAANVDDFWRNLAQGVESVRSFTPAELAAAGIDSAVLKDPGYVNAGIVLEEADAFDAAFFGYHPREAELMDPQQRAFLECAWTALEHAGYDPETCEGLIGVYGGVARNNYLPEHILSRPELVQAAGTHQLLIGNEKDFPATRVSFKLNLRGPSLNVQSACSSSGVAIHLACQSLLGGECDLALAGAACIRIPLVGGYFYKDGGIDSPDGRCRAFDARARGTIIGSGVAMLVLKRCSDALRDGDWIHAVIKGTAINNDGSDKVGFTAPSVEGQARVIAEAHAMAGIEAGTISYVEAHGTGTALGDPIEITALTRAFHRTTDKKGFCAIGSVKTNIGHLDAAAGVAGVIKTVLALQHRQLPPSLNFEKPNPEIDFAASPFYVNTKLAEWNPAETPRRAGVSSFGLGGTNSHVILEEAPAVGPPGPSRSAQLLLLSAKTASALDCSAAQLAAHLEQNPQTNQADVAYTLQTGRRHFNFRRFLVCRDAADAGAKLRLPPAKSLPSKQSLRPDPAVTFMFPGQGAQHLGMARELFQREPLFSQCLGACADILKPHLGFDLRDAIYPAREDDAARQRINQTQVAQPAIFAIEYALARLWMDWGIQPHNFIGHSVGEYVAACLAGVFSLEDILRLIARRGRLMQDLPCGKMLAVALGPEEAKALLGKELSLAAVNGKSNCVISGPDHAVADLERLLAEKRIACRQLASSHAFHSAMVDPVLDPFLEEVKRVRLHTPRIPFISSPTGAWITPAQAADPAYWARHMRETVQFHNGLREILKEPDGILLEVGPGELLGPLARHSCREAPGRVVLASLARASDEHGDLPALLRALGRLWLEGVKVDWKAFYRHEHRRRVPLPTYPFERKRFWIEPPAANRRPIPDTPVVKAVPAAVASPASDIQTTAPHGQITTVPAPFTWPNGSPLVNRQNRIAAELGDILRGLSGLTREQIPAGTTFLSLGFDSLFLTQAGLAFQKQFGVKVTLRQLLEEYPSVESLAGYLDARIPRDPAALAVAELTQPAMREVRRAPILNSAPDPGPIDYRQAMEQILQKQMQFMSDQLALVRAAPATAADSAAPGPPAAPPAAPHPSEEPMDGRWFGPFKPPAGDRPQELTARQKDALADLITRYTRRTGESRRLTQLHRNRLADPRSISGFRRLWKQMVYPIVATRSAGSKIRDVDGNDYVDFTMGFGVHLFGHSPAFVTEAVADQLRQGIQIGPQSPLAGEVAEMLCRFTGLERITFCNTGSEAVLAALRAARTVTGRNRVARFSGSYHGIQDEVLIRAKTVDGIQRLLPATPGLVPEIVANALVLAYGQPESLRLIEARAHELAAILVEPVQSRHPDLQPREFLHQLRELASRCGCALVFDEVITGFRLHAGGAQAWYGVPADLATYGKVIGGGLPLGAVAGKARFMDAFDGGTWDYGDDTSPEAGVTFFAGTFMRHPLALRAAAAVLNHLRDSGPDLQKRLNERSAQLAGALNDCFDEQGAALRVLNCGSIFHFRFGEEQPLGNLLFYYLREKGVHIWEGRPCFLSTAHSDQDIESLLQAFRDSVSDMQAGGFLSGGCERTGPLPAPVSPPEPEPVRVPLTAAQLEIWLEAQKGAHASCRYNESVTLRLLGPFNLPAMREAIQSLVDRHEALRAVFSRQGDYQEIRPRLVLEVPEHDLRTIDPPERSAHVTELQLGEGQIPFDLANGPLARARIVCTGEEEHLLLMTFHHIVCDGWSLTVLLRELGELYTAADRKAGPRLAPATRFSDYVARQSTAAQIAETFRCEAHWLQRLAGQLPVLELPADRIRPATKRYRGKRILQVLPAALSRDLRHFSAQANVTLFTTLLAGFEVLLHRLSVQDSLLVGIPVSGQALVDGLSLVGHCTHLLPVRSEFRDSMKFMDFLECTCRELMDVSEHQHCTLGTLVRKLNLARDPSRAPLVPVTFNLDRDQDQSGYSRLTVELSANPKSFLNLDLNLNIRDTGGTLQLECDFDTDLFDLETIQRWLRHYQTMLEAIAADSGRTLGHLPLLTPAECRQLVVDWNRTASDYPARTIAELFEEQAATTPDAVAVVLGGREMSYAELNARANQLAHHLVALGVGPDQRVGVCAERSLELIITLLGILKAGGAYVPLEAAAPPVRLRAMLQDARPLAIIVQSKLRMLALEAASARLAGPPPPHIVCLEKDLRLLERNSTANPENTATPENLAYVCFTSGSTGRPKGVCIPQRGVVRLVRNTNYISISPADVFLQFAPISFDASTFEIWGCLLNGARLVVFPPQFSSLAELGAVIRKHRVSVLWLTAGLFHQMIEGQLESLKGVRQVLAGGDVLSVAHVRKALQKLGEASLINGYGPTENTTFTCCHPITHSGAAGRSIPIGRPIANSQVFILDSNLQAAPIGVAGELFAGGDGLALGYLNQPELTAEKFVPNPFQPGTRLYRTGDLARWLSDGSIEFLGRADLQVKIRGFRIELGEIESALEAHPAVSQAVTAAREDVPGEKRLVAYFTSRRNPPPTAVELRSFLAERLPDYMAPSVFVWLKSLPLTENGKVDRRALPPPDSHRPELERDYAAPRDPVETQLVAIWEALLGIEPIGIRDRFFDLGGHSLLAVRLFAQIERIFGKRIPFTALFQAPTIEQLAELVRAKRSSPERSLLVAIQESGISAPLFLVHGAGGGMLWGYTNLAVHLGPGRPVYGIESRGMHGAEEFENMEDMARCYVDELRTLQPEGPYHLGGYCFGGNVACEMARQLCAQQQRVALLALFESSPIKGSYDHPRWWRPRFAFDFARNLCYWLRYLAGIDPHARRDMIQRRLRAGFRNLLWRSRHSTQETRPIDVDSVVDVSQIPESELNLWRAHLRIIDRYAQAPYPGQITLFRTRRQPLWCSFDYAYGWRELAAGGITVRFIPGTHESIFVEPNVRVTAAALQQCLDQSGY